MWLGYYLAARGYIVAAVNHHGNTSAEQGRAAQGFLLYWERATDLSAVLDRLLANPVFGARIDRNRIGAAGSKNRLVNRNDPTPTTMRC